MIEERDLLKARLCLNTLLSGYLTKLKQNPSDKIKGLKDDLLETYGTFKNLESQYMKQCSLNWDLMIEVEKLTKENNELKEKNKNLLEGI